MPHSEIHDFAGPIDSGTLRVPHHSSGIYISATDAIAYADALAKILRALPSPIVQMLVAEATTTSKLIDLLLKLEQPECQIDSRSGQMEGGYSFQGSA